MRKKSSRSLLEFESAFAETIGIEVKVFIDGYELKMKNITETHGYDPEKHVRTIEIRIETEAK